MKFKVHMKDPDGVYDSLEEAAKESINLVQGISDKERAVLLESRRECLQEAAGKWFKYGEYLTVEIDTEAGTCTVIEED